MQRYLEVSILIPTTSLDLDDSEEGQRQMAKDIIPHLFLMYHQYIYKLLPEITPDTLVEFLNKNIDGYGVEYADGTLLPNKLKKNVVSTYVVTIGITDELADYMLEHENAVCHINVDAKTDMPIKGILRYYGKFSMIYTVTKKQPLN